MSSSDAVNTPVVWRTKLRSELPQVVHADQVQYCLDNGLIGTGWGLEELPDGAPYDDVLRAVAGQTDSRRWGTAAGMVRRFGRDTQIGDFVWTRDTDGKYRLCRITGDYRYVATPQAKAVDVFHSRAVDWATKPLNDLEVPGGVIRSFVGPGQSWCRVKDLVSRRMTWFLWQKLHGAPLPHLGLSPHEVLASSLDPYDVEDLVYIWFQATRGYLMLPRARDRSMPKVEWTMIHQHTHRRAIVQVKTGDTPVDLEELAAARADQTMDTYAFATSGRYRGDTNLVTEIIRADDLLEFVRDHPDLLPLRVRTWFDLATPT